VRRRLGTGGEGRGHDRGDRAGHGLRTPATTRALGAFVRKELGLPKQRVQALGYWRAS